MIAVAGTIVVDVPAHPVTGMPDRGGLEAVERIDLYVGGAVANTGMALSRLGVPVGAIGCVGKDSLGRIVLEELSRWAEGLWIREDETRSTSATLVLVHPDGERTFISAVGANAGLEEEYLPWEELVEAGTRAIHLGYALCSTWRPSPTSPTEPRRSTIPGSRWPVPSAWWRRRIWWCPWSHCGWRCGPTTPARSGSPPGWPGLCAPLPVPTW